MGKVPADTPVEGRFLSAGFTCFLVTFFLALSTFYVRGKRQDQRTDNLDGSQPMVTNGRFTRAPLDEPDTIGALHVTTDRGPDGV